VFVYEDKDFDAAHIAESASRATYAESRGYQNRPDVQFLVLGMAERTRQVTAELAKVVGTRTEMIQDVLTAIVAQGHVVFDSAPDGIEAIVLHALAEVLGLTFRPVEITRETNSSQLTGSKGFAQMVLADGLNRAPLPTQVVLLEAMQEYHVTIDGHQQLIEHPFVVLATQKPGPCSGAQALSEAQLDRFVFSISARSQADLNEGMLRDHGSDGRTVALQKVLTARQVMQLQRATRDLPLSDHLVKHVVKLVRATRPADKHAPDFVKHHVHAGAGPRAAEDLVVAAKARAIVHGRLSVSLEDVQHVASAVLRHRICMKFSANADGISPDALVEMLLANISSIAGDGA
jgi:MoxR-like ATPase